MNSSSPLSPFSHFSPELDTFVHVRVFPLPATEPDLLAIFIEKSHQQIHAFKPSDASDHEVVMLKTRVRKGENGEKGEKEGERKEKKKEKREKIKGGRGEER